MAYFAARDSLPRRPWVQMVAQTDVYVGTIGLRYRSPVRRRPDVSCTELEFEAASEHDQLGCQRSRISLIVGRGGAETVRHGYGRVGTGWDQPRRPEADPT